MKTIIPTPNNVEQTAGSFALVEGLQVYISNDHSELLQFAEYLLKVLPKKDADARPKVLSDCEDRVDGIVLRLVDSADADEEAYSLQVTPERILLQAAGQAGLAYGVQSLMQMLSADFDANGAVIREIPCVKIEDAPRFKWRGMMLDVTRHFFHVPVVKKLIDSLHLYKINKLHMHLNDDQGWRLDIKKHPEFTTTAAWRDEDGNRYGGFYTQDEMAELVAYASERYITIIPEIEMPGHCLASLSAHPHLSCSGGPFKIWTGAGICEEVYCVGKEETFELLCDVIDEVVELFPSPYIHIGGDEVPKKRWSECECCQKRKEDEGLANEEELHVYFMNRMANYLKEKSKTPVMWDDVLEGGAPKNTKVMFWRDGTDSNIKALESGLDLIMTPTTHCYFDYKQAETDKMGQIGVVTLESAYAFNPCPDKLLGFEGKVLGGQANVWTETIFTLSELEYMVFPRICAIAESVWTQTARKDWKSFVGRLQGHYTYFDRNGINARPMDGVLVGA